MNYDILVNTKRNKQEKYNTNVGSQSWILSYNAICERRIDHFIPKHDFRSDL